MLKKSYKHDIAVVVDRLVAGPDILEPRHRLRRDGAGARGRRHAGQLRRRRGGCRVAVLLREARLPERPPAAAHRDRAPHVLVQRAVRRLPGLLRPRHAHVGRCRPHARRRGAVDPRGRAHPVDDPGQGTLPVLRAPARRPRERPRLLARHPVEEAARRTCARRCCAARTTRSPCGGRTATAARCATRRASRASCPTSSGSTRRPSPTRSASAGRSTCARCRAPCATATGSSRRCSPCSCTGIRSRMPRA